MAHQDCQRTLAAARAAHLDDFDHFLLGKEVFFNKRSTLLDTARRFICWLDQRDRFGDLRGMAGNDEKAMSLREAFLIADCPDRDGRHDLRAHVNQFLRFLSTQAKATSQI